MEMNRNVIIMIAGAFIVGLLFGYGILGEKESKKLDAKQMINSILAEIDTLEKENQGLKARLKEDKQSQIATENKALQDELEKSRKENSDLKKLLDQTKAELNQSESKIKSNEVLMSITDDLKNEISLLEKENAELKMTLETIGSLTTIEKTATSAPVQEERKDEQK
jgi:hypothetical protein